MNIVASTEYDQGEPLVQIDHIFTDLTVSVDDGRVRIEIGGAIGAESISLSRGEAFWVRTALEAANDYLLGQELSSK